MYGELRLIPENKVTSIDMVSVSSRADGTKGDVVKNGLGAATMTVQGLYQADYDLAYTVKCDSVAAGVGVGDATIRWRTSRTIPGAWEQIGITTVSTPAIPLAADGLGSDLSIAFTGGVGDDFAVNDEFWFITRAKYGPGKLLDRDRYTRWASEDATVQTITIDFGAAERITVALLQDHNITSGATVKLYGNTSDSWGSPAYTYTFGSIADILHVYLDQTYQYWRWEITDTSNPDGYIYIGNMAMAEYQTLEKQNFEWGLVDTSGYVLQSNQSEPGVLRRYVYAPQQRLAGSFGETLSNADVDTLRSAAKSLIDSDTKQVKPLWVHLFSDEGSFLFLMDWVNIDQWSRTFRSYLLNSETNLVFDEVVKTL